MQVKSITASGHSEFTHPWRRTPGFAVLDRLRAEMLQQVHLSDLLKPIQLV